MKFHEIFYHFEKRKKSTKAYFYIMVTWDVISFLRLMGAVASMFSISNLGQFWWKIGISSKKQWKSMRINKNQWNNEITEITSYHEISSEPIFREFPVRNFWLLQEMLEIPRILKSTVSTSFSRFGLRKSSTDQCKIFAGQGPSLAQGTLNSHR